MKRSKNKQKSKLNLLNNLNQLINKIKKKENKDLENNGTLINQEETILMENANINQRMMTKWNKTESKEIMIMKVNNKLLKKEISLLINKFNSFMMKVSSLLVNLKLNLKADKIEINFMVKLMVENNSITMVQSVIIDLTQNLIEYNY